MSSGWQASCLAQFLISPDLSTRALWQFLPAESFSSKTGETWAKKHGWWILPAKYLFHACHVLLHAVNLWHGTDSFTSPPKEVMLWIFIALKRHHPQQGFNLWTLGPVASTLPLDHWGCLIIDYILVNRKSAAKVIDTRVYWSYSVLLRSFYAFN
jgi:hypothetical protein